MEKRFDLLLTGGLVVTGTGGDVNTAWIGAWAGREEMHLAILEALTSEED